jgi:hypothetical protein
LVHQLAVNVLAEVAATTATVCHEAVDLLTYAVVGFGQRVLRTLAENADGGFGAHCQTVLALPAPTPAEAVEVFYLGTTVDKSQHLTGADVYASAATGALVLVYVKFRFVLLHNYRNFILSYKYS